MVLSPGSWPHLDRVQPALVPVRVRGLVSLSCRKLGYPKNLRGQDLTEFDFFQERLLHVTLHYLGRPNQDKKRPSEVLPMGLSEEPASQSVERRDPKTDGTVLRMGRQKTGKRTTPVSRSRGHPLQTPATSQGKATGDFQHTLLTLLSGLSVPCQRPGGDADFAIDLLGGLGQVTSTPLSEDLRTNIRAPPQVSRAD